MSQSKYKIAVLGGGSWATALIKILCEDDVQVNWWLRNANDISHIKNFRVNPRYLSSVQIDLNKVHPLLSLENALKDVEMIVIAVPAAYVVSVFNKIDPKLFQNKIIISAVKGMVPGENMLVSDYAYKYLNVPLENLCAIAGPCHAEEVAQEKRSYITVAGHHIDTAQEVANLLDCRFVNTAAVLDMYGVEYCAVMKNVIAVACGIARGLNYGDNFQAVLVPNAIQEISAFLHAIDPLERNLTKTEYLGDLLVTTYSQFSRNRTLGSMIGRGYTVKSAQMEMGMVAEGYFAVQCIYSVKQELKVEMPITQAVYNVLYERISPAIELKILEDLLN